MENTATWPSDMRNGASTRATSMEVDPTPRKGSREDGDGVAVTILPTPSPKESDTKAVQKFSPSNAMQENKAPTTKTPITGFAAEETAAVQRAEHGRGEEMNAPSHHSAPKETVRIQEPHRCDGITGFERIAYTKQETCPNSSPDGSSQGAREHIPGRGGGCGG